MGMNTVTILLKMMPQFNISFIIHLKLNGELTLERTLKFGLIYFEK